MFKLQKCKAKDLAFIPLEKVVSLSMID